MGIIGQPLSALGIVAGGSAAVASGLVVMGNSLLPSDADKYNRKPEPEVPVDPSDPGSRPVDDGHYYPPDVLTNREFSSGIKAVSSIAAFGGLGAALTGALIGKWTGSPAGTTFAKAAIYGSAGGFGALLGASTTDLASRFINTVRGSDIR